MSAREFAAEIDEEWAKKEREVRAKIIEVATYLAEEIIDRSPVLTGRFAGNWNASIGVPDPHTTINVDPKKQATKTRAKNKIEEYRFFAKYPPIYISNGLPYANRLENGWSKQAPNGVVGVAISNATMKYRRIIL